MSRSPAEQVAALGACIDRLIWHGSPQPDIALDVDGWTDNAASPSQADAMQRRAEDRTAFVFGGAA